MKAMIYILEFNNRLITV